MTNLQLIRERFSTEEDCFQYLAKVKWSQGYRCTKCGCEKYYKGRKRHHRKCAKCSFDESPTSGTLFHKIKFSLITAFEMIYWITQTKKGMSTLELASHFGVNQTTAWKFKKKIQLAMSQEGYEQLKNIVEVDEFVTGGPKKKAQGRSLGKKPIALLGVEKTLTRKGKVGIKRAYCQVIDGYSNEDFRPFFKERIDKKAKIKADKWSGYKPLNEEYKIKQVYSKSGKNFLELHNCIMNIKSWMRGIHHKVSQGHLQGYLDEFCFRFNNKFGKKSAWEILVEEMIWTYPIYGKDLYLGN